MSYIPHGSLSSANYIQSMAKQTNNEKLGLLLTTLSVTLIGKMVWDQFKEKPREDPERQKLVRLLERLERHYQAQQKGYCR